MTKEQSQEKNTKHTSNSWEKVILDAFHRIEAGKPLMDKERLKKFEEGDFQDD